MNITFQTALEHGLEPTAALLTQGFSGYFVPIQIPLAGLLTMVRHDSVDLQLSRVLIKDEQPVGVALIARRGWTSRLAAMSIIPEARGKGIGAVCVRQLLDEARARGDKAMTLEVIEQNTPGVALYKKCGFQIQRRLMGFTGQPQVEKPDLVLKTVDVREVARNLIAHGPDDLPWQDSGETLAQLGPPSIAYASDASYVALSNPEAATIAIRAIVTLPHMRRRGAATELVRAVIAHHPGKTWRVAAHFPEELAGLFEKVGLARDQLSQWQMLATL
jgi:GNAT superfamily N-acetyltransferase